MTVYVVDSFEVIDVANDQAETGAAFARLGRQVFQHRVEVCPIGNTCEDVCCGLLMKRLKLFLQIGLVRQIAKDQRRSIDSWFWSRYWHGLNMNRNWL